MTTVNDTQIEDIQNYIKALEEQVHLNHLSKNKWVELIKSINVESMVLQDQLESMRIAYQGLFEQFKRATERVSELEKTLSEL